MNFVEKRILVVGLGESRVGDGALVEARRRAPARIADTRSQPDRLSQLQGLAPEVEFFRWCFASRELENIDAVFVSPGLARMAT